MKARTWLPVANYLLDPEQNARAWRKPIHFAPERFFLSGVGGDAN
jgi:hypothetical protein